MEVRDMALADGIDASTGMVSDMDIEKRVLEGDTASFELIMRRGVCVILFLRFPLRP
jgi:hypothetical protein